MKEYKDIARRVALILSIVLLIANVIINRVVEENPFSLITELVIVVVLGVLLFFVMEWLPKLLVRETSLCGLYLIAYSEAKNNLCSVLDVTYDNKRMGYCFKVYDCYLRLSDSRWVAVKDHYPQTVDEVYYDIQPESLCLISNDNMKKSCMFIRFARKGDTGMVIRYGSKNPFHKPHEGKLMKLSNDHLCAVYNPDQNDTSFCNMKLSELELCKTQKRINCKNKAKSILNRVRDARVYLEIPKVLYRDFKDSHVIEDEPPKKATTVKKATATGSSTPSTTDEVNIGVK
jgi:hypothetical protein